MRKTIEYKNLETQLKIVKKIVSRVHLQNCSSTTDVLKVNSYILMCHAAFESYLENLVGILMTKSIAKYNSSNGTMNNKCITSLISMHSIDIYKTSLSQPSNSRNVWLKSRVKDISINTSTKINEAKSSVAVVVRKNHGIKSSNINTMFNCIGIYPEDIDISLCNDLDSFGTSRGGIAHVVQIRQILSKSEAISKVDNIKSKLLDFERAVFSELNL